MDDKALFTLFEGLPIIVGAVVVTLAAGTIVLAAMAIVTHGPRDADMHWSEKDATGDVRTHDADAGAPGSPRHP